MKGCPVPKPKAMMCNTLTNLQIVAGDNVAHRAQRWHEHRRRLVPAHATTRSCAGATGHSGSLGTIRPLPPTSSAIMRCTTQLICVQACLQADMPRLHPMGRRQLCLPARLSLQPVTKNTHIGWDAGISGDGACERRRAQQQLDQAAAHAGLDDLLDLVVGAVGEVRQRPARVRQHLLVVGVDQLGQRRQRQLGLRAAA